MKLALLNKVEAFVREVIGTILQIDGFDHIELISTNVEGEKQVMVDVFIDGEDNAERMFCSRKVSEGLRDKSITAGELLNLPLAIAEREDGTTFYQIQMPSRESSVLKIDKSKAKKPAARKAVADWKELVAY